MGVVKGLSVADIALAIVISCFFALYGEMFREMLCMYGAAEGGVGILAGDYLSLEVIANVLLLFLVGLGVSLPLIKHGGGGGEITRISSLSDSAGIRRAVYGV